MENKISADDIINFLNELLKDDKDAIEKLIVSRVLCNDKLANHPTVQVGMDRETGFYRVGMLGILNGLFGLKDIDNGFICGVFDEDNKLIEFKRS